MNPTRGRSSGDDWLADPAVDPARFGLGPPPFVSPPLPAPRPEPQPRERPCRGQAVGVVALVAAVIGAALLGGTLYAALDAVHVVSFDPLGAAWGWIVAFGIVAVGALGVVVFAVVALAWCRPRRTAGVALVASIVLPVLAVVLAGSLGVAVAKQHAAAELAADGGLVDSAADVAESWNVDVGPFRGLLKSIAAASG